MNKIAQSTESETRGNDVVILKSTIITRSEKRMFDIGAIGGSGISDDELLEGINKRFASSPLSLNDIHLFDLEPSNDLVDGYYTRMADDTLDNYTNTLNDTGIALMSSHKDDRLPTGRLMRGERYNDKTGIKRIDSTAFMLKNYQTEAGNTDDLIRGIQAGIIRDVSIGFVPGSYECSECGNDMMGNDCTHYPGQKLNNDPIQRVYAWVKNGRLLETSLVYKGATPQAAITKVRMLAKDGLIKRDEINDLNSMYGKRIANDISQFFVKENILSDTTMTFTESLKNSLKTNEETRGEVLKVFDLKDESKRAEQLASIINSLYERNDSENKSLVEKAERLEKVEKEFAVYKRLLVNEAVTAGVRALGLNFDVETHRSIFENMSVDKLQTLTQNYERQATAFWSGYDMERSEKDGKEIFTPVKRTEGGAQTMRITNGQIIMDKQQNKSEKSENTGTKKSVSRYIQSKK